MRILEKTKRHLSYKKKSTRSIAKSNSKNLTSKKLNKKDSRLEIWNFNNFLVSFKNVKKKFKNMKMKLLI